MLSLAWQESPLGVRGQGTSSTSSLRGFNAFPPPLDSPTTPMTWMGVVTGVAGVVVEGEKN